MSEHNTRPSQPRDHATLMALAERLGKPLYTLHVMASNTDPFLAGMRARLRDAQWFAKVWNDLGAKRGFHLRRLHYLVVSQDPPVLLPDGTPYINTQRCAAILYDAGRDARHLGLVDADDLVDRKNPAPRVYLQEGKPSEIVCQGGLGDMSPTLEIPCLRLAAPIIAQPYQVELWCEKSTMDDILDPLGQRYGVNVQTGTGELSLTHCVGLVRRAQASGLPVRILYISDFDPAGAGMPLAVARKIEHILYREELYDLDIQVRPIVLTHDQCVEYRLPRSPIKESETRAGPFEERFGEGATELDAFEALHPGELERILVKEIERYYDTSLDAAAEDTAADVQSDLDALNREVHAAHARGIAKLKRERKKALAAIRAFKRKANPILRKIQNDLDAQVPDVDLYDWPAPEEGDEDPDPMFDSARTYLEQIDRYKQHQGKSSERKPPKEREKFTCTCQFCGKSFQSRRSNARACSAICRTNLWRQSLGREREPITCPGCGKSFTPTRASATYCSHRCQSKMWARRRRS
jgi:hypothetical protein